MATEREQAMADARDWAKVAEHAAREDPSQAAALAQAHALVALAASVKELARAVQQLGNLDPDDPRHPRFHQ